SHDRQPPEGRIPADDLHRLISVHVRHHDVHQNDSDIRSRLKCRDRFPAGARRQNRHSASFENAAERKDVAHVVIYNQYFFPHERFVGMVQEVKHLLLFLRQISYNAMQKEGGFVQKPFRRLDTFHYHAASQHAKAGILVRRKVFASEDHYRQVTEHRGVAETFKYFKSGHIWKTEIEYH